MIVTIARTPPRTSITTDRSVLLTDREAEVLTLLALGRSNAEVGDELCLSIYTVKTHVGHLLAKLGRRDRAQLVALAYTSGFMGSWGAGPTFGELVS